MYGVSRVAEAVFGQSTFVVGLQVVPTSPASLQVNINPGQLYQYTNADSSSWSDLSTDLTQILQQGLLTTTTNFNIPTPSTSGYSQYYLIEAQFAQLDSNLAVLPYYNSTNPASPLSGPGGSGTSQTQDRLATVNIVLKAGSAAPTGSQMQPSVDSGFTALGYVLVANGQSSITTSNITDARPVVTNLPTHESQTPLTNNVHGMVYGNGGNVNASLLGGYPASAFVLASGNNLSGAALLAGNNVFTGTNQFNDGINPNTIINQQLSSDPSSPSTGQMWYNITDGHFRGISSNSSGTVRFLTEADMGTNGIINAALLDGQSAQTIQNNVTAALQPQLNNTLNFTRTALLTGSVATNGSSTVGVTFGFAVKNAIVAVTRVDLAANGGHAQANLSSIAGNTVNVAVDVSTSPGNGRVDYAVIAFG